VADTNGTLQPGTGGADPFRKWKLTDSVTASVKMCSAYRLTHSVGFHRR
jgi:hypothetical protein